MKYIRRPYLMGNTALSVLTQPYILGNTQKNAAGNFDFTPNGEIIVESDQSAGEQAVLFTSAAMSSILSDLNAVPGILAEDIEGCLKISSTGTGEGSFIRIIQCADSGVASGAADVAGKLGLPVMPNPMGEVTGGTLEAAPVRPGTERNWPGALFLAQGEDRVGKNFNRALNQLSGNADALHTMLTRPIAVPVSVEVDKNAVFWSTRFSVDGNGEIDQINLSDLENYDADLVGRIFVGGLSRLSSLNDIAAFFAVQDSDDKEILVGQNTVRIGAVTRGQRLTGAPVFASESAAPSPALNDTTGIASDGRSALGVDRTKQSSVAISEIQHRTVLVCPGALFESRGVVPGDKAVISGSSIVVPFGHNGTYIVEQVISEAQIAVRPSDDENVRGLNPGDGPGSLGNLVVSSGGQWEKDIWVTLVPPLPRWPDDGKVRLVLGVEFALGQLPADAILGASVRTSEEVDAWVQTQLWRRQALQGAYDGMGNGRGGGAVAAVDDRPATFISARPASAATGALALAGTGAIESGNVLKAEAADTFTLSRVGCAVTITGASNGTSILCHIDRFIDGAHVRLVPPLDRPLQSLAVEAVTYQVITGARYTLPATVQVVVPAYLADGATAPAPWGFGVVHEQTDTDPATEPLRSCGYSHLERLKVGRAVGGADIDVTTIDLTLQAATNVASTSVNLEECGNIYPENAAATRTVNDGSRPGTLLRILTGAHAGWYRITETSVAPDEVTVIHLDGSTPSFAAGTAKGALYNSFFATGITTASLLGFPAMEMGVWAYTDSKETGAVVGAALGVGWRGVGIGIWATLNDPEFKSYDDDTGAEGPLMLGVLYPPAVGPSIAGTAATSGDRDRRTMYAYDGIVYGHAMDWGLETPSDYYGWAGRFIQAGKDPAAIVLKYEGASATKPDPESFLSPAALVVGYGGSHVGRGGAIEVIGSIYQWDRPAGETTFTPGGIYSEVGANLGRWLAPMYGQIVPGDQPYEGTGTYVDLEAPTRLGAPGRMLPPGANSSPVAGSILVANHALFNFSHWGRLRRATANLDLPTSQYVGAKVLVDVDSTGSPDYGGESFVIVGVHDDGVDTHFALRDNGVATAPAGTHTVTFSIHGQRWYYAHLDLADWARIGTRFAPDENWTTPILTVGQFSYLGVDRAARQGSSTDINKAGSGLLSPATFWPRTDGEGLGLGDDLSSMVNFSAAVTTDDAAWNNAGTPVYTNSLWAQDNKEPRNPFPNAAIITSSDGRLTKDWPGSLVCDEIALEHVVRNSANGHTAEWSSNYGGALMVTYTGGDVATDTLRIWFRGVHGINTLHYGLRLTVIVARDGGLQATAHLRKSDGTSVASEVVDTGIIVGETPDQVTAEFVLSDLVDRAFDSISKETLYDEPLHFTLDFDSVTQDANTAPIYFIKVALEQLVRPAKTIGPVDVSGAIRAHSYRYMSTVRGFETVTPLQVEFLRPAEYAKLYGQNDGAAGYDYGELEGRSVGLWKVPNSEGGGADYLPWGNSTDGSVGNSITSGTENSWVTPVVDYNRVFRKGAHSAAIVGCTPAFDPMFYVLRSMPYGIADATNPDAASFVIPGRTGFVIPFNPPHGARLTSLHLGLSLNPCWSRNEATNAIVANFQVWNDHRSLSAGLTKGQWRDKTTWDGYEGLRIQLWRYHAMDFGLGLDTPTFDGTAPGSSNSPDFGFSEVIYEEDVDLSGVSESAYNTNPNGAATSWFGREYHFKKAYDLHQLVAQEQRLIVDRRHFGYFATVSFWIGCRSEENNPATLYGYPAGDWEYHTPTLFLETPNNVYYHASRVAFALNQNTLSTGGFWPAQVKYRGARLGWETDRGGHGGWG